MKNKAREYRERAEQLRALAASMKDETARTTLLAVAADYNYWADKFDPRPDPLSAEITGSERAPSRKTSP